MQKEFGEDHPFFATRLEKIAENFIDLGKNQEAVQLLERTLFIRRKKLGQNHPACASALGKLALASFRAGQGRSAEEYLREALQIRKNAFGPQHPSVRAVRRDLKALLDLNEQAAILPEALEKYHEAQEAQQRGEFERAERRFKEAIQLNSVQRGISHPHTAECKSALADLYLQTSRPNEALPLLTEVAWVQSATKEEHPKNYASAIVQLGRANAQLGFYAEAEKQLTHAIALMEEAAVGGELLAGALNALGTVYVETHRTRDAMPLMKRAAEILKERHAGRKEVLATVYSNLASGCINLGRYAEAEEYYHQALTLKRESLGESHPSYARSLGNYGVFCSSVGRYAEATRCISRALELLEHFFGPASVEQSNLLDALSKIAFHGGQISEAIESSKRAEEILTKSYGSTHPKALFQLLRSAKLLCDARDYGEAEARLTRASELLKSANSMILGRRCIRLQGHLALLKGKYTDAFDLLDEAISMPSGDSSDVSGEDAFALEEYIRAALLLGNYKAALARLDEFESALAVASRDIVGSTGDEMEGLVATLPSALINASFTILSIDEANTQEMAKRCLLYLLRYRGCSLDILAARQRFSISRSDVSEFFESARQARKKLHDLVLTGPLPGRSDEYLKAVLETKQEIWRSEQRLNASVVEGMAGQLFKSLTETDLAAAMPAKSSLVEFIKFRSIAHDFDPQFAALIFEPSSRQIKWVRLGPTEELERWLTVWRDEISVPPASRIGGLRERAEQRLVELLIAPVIDNLTTPDIWIVPDGELWSVPFEALPDGQGKRLCDRFRIAYLSASRDLIENEVLPVSDAPPMIFADPDFDLADKIDSEARRDAQMSAEMGSSEHPTSGISLSRPQEQFWEKSGLQPSPTLPGTRVEAEEIGEIIGAKPILGSDALDPTFKAARKPSVLHVGTHGLFLDSPKQWSDILFKREMYGSFISLGARMEKSIFELEDTLESLRNALGESSVGSDHVPANIGAHFDDAMLCSGLLFAGVNSWLSNGEWANRAEDGIVTAQDVLGMNLIGTEMVVLSGCETGRGAVKNQEGIFGLRRAFRIAGARTLVMSLWRVSDDTSRILMTHFYKELHKGASRCDSMCIARERVRMIHPDPYFWAPFICQGDQSSLSCMKRQP